jgi:hypothetical protein
MNNIFLILSLHEEMERRILMSSLKATQKVIESKLSNLDGVGLLFLRVHDEFFDVS